MRFLHPLADTSFLAWVAVKELKLSYRNGSIYIYIDSNEYGFPNIVT